MLQKSKIYIFLLCLGLAFVASFTGVESASATKNCGSAGPWKRVVVSKVKCKTARKLARKVPRSRPTGVFGKWKCYGMGGGAECQRKKNPKPGVGIGLYYR